MTPVKHPLSVLIVNDEPEEIKVVATSLREFFPGCRLEAVYTSDEALQSSVASDWDLFLIDDTLTPRDGIAILPELRRHNPHAAIILQSDRRDSENAIQALRQGADFILFKNSSAFLTDLLSYAQEALEKRALEAKLEQTFQRHLRLVESVSDVVYELDQEGRFIYVSPTITPLLGYAPEDLAGQHFAAILSPTEDSLARYRMNERRAGARSVRGLELIIIGKASPAGIIPKMRMQLTAKGLYDARGRFLGTMGLLRDVSGEHRQNNKVQELEDRLREANRQLAATQQATVTTQHLQQPLSALLQDSHRLLTTLQGVQIEQHLRQLATYATQASELSQEVWRTIQFKSHPLGPVSLNEELQHVISDLVRDHALPSSLIEERCAPALPSLAGNADSIRDMLHILLLYALHSLSASPSGSGLVIETYALKTAGDAPPWSPPSASVLFSHYLVIVIRHSVEQRSRPHLPLMPSVSGPEFLRAHELVRQHGGAIEIRSAFTPGFQITLRFPALFSGTTPSFGRDPHPGPVSSAPLHHPSDSSLHAAPSGAADRRRAPRIPINVPVDLTIGTSVGQSTAVDIGLGGILLASGHPTPPTDQQPAYLILRTPVSFLELQGTVYRRAATAGDDRLVIVFSPLSSTEEAILLSFTESLREASMAHKIEVLIAEATARPTMASAGPRGIHELRWHVRAQFESRHPVMIHAAANTSAFPGIIVNAGRGGLCIRLMKDAAQEAFPQIVTTDPSVGPGRTILVHSPRLGELRGRIVWGPAPTTDNAWLVGICFEDLPFTARENLNRLLAPEFRTGLRSTGASGPAGPVTSLHLLPDRHGRIIALSHDRVTQDTQDLPVVVISPGYAQTRIDYMALAYALARHGYRVLRYDAAHGCGLSDGDARFLTMDAMRDSLEAVLDFVSGMWPTAPSIILAADLSARIALRLAADRRAPAMLFLMDPVLDFRADLLRFHHRDLVAEAQAGRRQGVINLLGLPIDADAFLLGAVHDGYLDLSSTRRDLERITCPVCVLDTGAERTLSGYPLHADAASIREALDVLGSRGSQLSLATSLASLGSTLSERQQAALQHILGQCAGLLPRGAKPNLAVEVIDHSTAHAQYRLEREQQRSRTRETLTSRSGLLAQFASHSRSLSEIHSYLQVYDHMYQALHRAEVPSNILELGCGHFGFARLWWLNEFYKLWSSPRREPRRTRYMALDVHAETVRAAREGFTTIQRYTSMVFAGVPTSPHTVSSAWIVAAMGALPFGGQHFDAIVCHFALNFVDNPVVLIRHLYHLLRPHGTLVVSSLTPFTDLSQLYRTYLHDTQQDAFASDHRTTLLDLAELHEALRCSHLTGFSLASLSELFSHVHPHPAMISPALNGHILIAIIQKLDSARRI